MQRETISDLRKQNRALSLELSEMHMKFDTLTANSRYADMHTHYLQLEKDAGFDLHCLYSPDHSDRLEISAHKDLEICSDEIHRLRERLCNEISANCSLRQQLSESMDSERSAGWTPDARASSSTSLPAPAAENARESSESYLEHVKRQNGWLKDALKRAMDRAQLTVVEGADLDDSMSSEMSRRAGRTCSSSFDRSYTSPKSSRSGRPKRSTDETRRFTYSPLMMKIYK
ncbi:hypothetical protein GUITHDRAFT_153369 [Guillardia theta CCMP2712]|uniref:Uncharacterized protein n=1 Tax=Guillardia theta (strain CCMP2712) TaxID=905079 RepID=L1J4W3_GUITC|nr:hypothetical protein GUITHDRAFT_153369 [Guillardia theta CCMP2712]EKX43164.1 hypothetical protein GUITHDRAFT_153369 [Guillardia theta CCMP2712]|eukprot:XP_005830144.1 hypothetical protein GUITHDRAFT_153369 [Guillardia theta CCMP2712]